MTITVPCPHCGEAVTVDVEHYIHLRAAVPSREEMLARRRERTENREEDGPPAGPPRPHLRGGT